MWQKVMNNVFTIIRDKAAKATADPQERNRLWWETLPMTYSRWQNENRMPSSSEEFDFVNRMYIESNPWLRDEFDFSGFRNQTVLEIGCGSGSASALFAAGGAKVTSVDLTKQAVAMTEANARTQGLYITTYRMDAENLAFPDETFDYVYSWGVIHHSNNPGQIMREIHRVLKKGARGLIMVYNKNSLRYYLKGLIWLCFKGKILHGHNLDSVQRFFTDGFHHRHYKSRELAAELSAAGLSVKRISKTHMAKKMLPLVPFWFDEALKRRFGWLLVVEFDTEANPVRAQG